ncbi:MAG: AAA family ATPase [Kiritimatiellae bacterium]|nr:AAA family ATPase [Kiritimatiellia bacterium]
MGDDKTDGFKGLEEQLKDMMRKANMAFITSPQEKEEVIESEDLVKKKKDRFLKSISKFDLKPRDIMAYLNRFVIGQMDAKKVLSVAICDHYNHVRQCLSDPDVNNQDYAKHNVILLGPTGVGKTYLVKCIAKLVGVPFVKADATKFSETGYVGHDVEDLVRDLVKAADGNTDLAQYGIIFVDEIDKIASYGTSGGKDVSGRGVQVNLLKLMEETDASLFSQTDMIGQMQAVMNMQKGNGEVERTINTRHILFIVSGAFDQLSDLVEKRIGSSSIGFVKEHAGEHENGVFLREVETKDFIEYGFEPEFIGRLPVRVVCDDLSVDDLEQILLNSEGSILSQYRNDFKGYNVALDVQPDAVRYIAELAHSEGTGARGLMTVMEKTFRDFKFEIPSTSLKRLTISRKIMEDTDAALDVLLQKSRVKRLRMLGNEINSFIGDFKKEHGLTLTIAATARAKMVEMCFERDMSVSVFCKEHFSDIEYGLKLIAKNTGRKTFPISLKFLRNPTEELSCRVSASLKKSK